LKNKNEILVGALTIIGLTLGILGFKFLQGDSMFTRSKYVYIVADRTNNIVTSNGVFENGVAIGRVDKIELSNSPNYSHKAIMRLKLNNNVFIPNNSKFIIYGLDMLGKMGIGHLRGSSTKEATDADTLECMVKGNAIDQGVDLISQLKPKLDTLLDNFSGLSANLNNQLGKGENGLLKKAVGDLSTTLVSVNRLAGNADKMISTLNVTISDNKGNLDGILKNVNQLTAKFNNETGKIDSILTNFEKLSGKLAALDLEATVTSARNTLEELKKTLKLVNDGDGSISKLLKEDGAYNDITKTINSLNALLTDLKANPKKYISLSLIDRSKTYSVTDTSVQQFLENNPKAAKKVGK